MFPELAFFGDEVDESAPTGRDDVGSCQFTSFNRDSQDIPESRRQPILAGMSGEERVSDTRHALLFESRLNDSLEYPSNEAMVRCRTTTQGCALGYRIPPLRGL